MSREKCEKNNLFLFPKTLDILLKYVILKVPPLPGNSRKDVFSMMYSLSLMSGGFARLVFWSSDLDSLLARADKGCGHYWLLGSYRDGKFLGYERI